MSIPILKVYDADGNQIPIPAIKGDTGATGPQGPPGPQGDPGATRWSQLLDKPFERIGTTMRVVDGTLDVYISESANPAGGNTLSIG